MKTKIKRLLQKYFPKCILGFLIHIIRLLNRARYDVEMKLMPNKMICFCPCCGMRFNSWKMGNYAEYPKWLNPQRYIQVRQDILCPCCESLPRHRILALWCQEHIETLKTSKILYFATEYSMTLWMKRNKIKYITADLFEKADLRLDIQNTELSDASYGVIICNHVLEHVDDFRKAIREVFRVLCPGGIFICSFPMDPNIELLDEDPTVQTVEQRFNKYGQGDHKRIFGMKADRFLTDAGFAVEKIKGEDCPSEILPVIGPADYDANVLFVCKKPL